MQRVADVEELFLPMQFEFMQSFGSLLSAEAVELLAMDTNDVAQIAGPAKNCAEDVVEFRELYLVGNRDQPDDHRAHLTENGPQNQAFDAECVSHPLSLRRTVDPRPSDALQPAMPALPAV